MVLAVGIVVCLLKTTTLMGPIGESVKRVLFGCIVLASAGIISGQERFSASLLIERSTHSSFAYEYSDSTSTYTVYYNSVGTVGASTGLGLALDWRLFSAGTSDLSLGFAYRFKASSDYRIKGVSILDDKAPYTDRVFGEYGHESFAIGAHYNWHRPMDFGVGLQLRREKLSLSPSSGMESGAISTHYLRPWIQGSVGHTFQSKTVKPFIALTMALPLSKTKLKSEEIETMSDDQVEEKVLKSLAPKFEMGLQVGIRF